MIYRSSLSSLPSSIDSERVSQAVECVHSKDGAEEGPTTDRVRSIRKVHSSRADVENEEELNRALNSWFDMDDAMRMETNRSEAKGEQGLQADDIEGGATIQKVFTNKSTGEVDLPPDGGYGWIVTLCVFLVMFSSWGCNSGFGVFLAFYLRSDTFAGANKYDYATIAGLTVGLGQGLAPLVAVCYKVIGLKPTMLFGTALMFAGFLLASFATKLWQLYLTQGVMVGVSISFMFVPATVVLPGWFLKKRAYAMGVSLMGTGCGGVTYGLAVNKMIKDNNNTKWALRMLCISCTCTMLVAIALMKQRNPLPVTGIRHWQPIVNQCKQVLDLRVMKNPVVPLITLWFVFSLFGYNLMIYTLSAYAQARGMSQHQGSTLTAITNGAQVVGRPLMGLAGDRFGRTNVTIVLTALLTIFLFGFWIPAHTFVQLIFFCICMGSCVGVANVMNTVLTADLLKPEEFLPAWSFANAAGSPYLLSCELISQALVTRNKSNPYLHTQCYAGACFSFALLMIFVLREQSVRQKLTRLAKSEDLDEEKYTDKDKTDAESQPSLLRTQSHRYDVLLGRGVSKYFRRMFYPMRT
ncbi:ESBP6 (YNL125C) [Zygosaccharomyces parabailii]|nr:ESBP6 (YNL125C) [Zygosaccharomyces parabailii]